MKSLRMTLNLALSLALLTSGCSSNQGGTTSGNPDAPEDSSSSGVVAEAVGGALTATNPNSGASSLKSTSHSALHQLATKICPTYHTTSGQGCNASGTTLWLDYDDCSFAGASIWSGFQAMIQSTGSPTCGSFPNPGPSGSLTIQYVTAVGATSPSSLSLTSSFGTTAVIDDATPLVGNFNGDPVTALANGGFGSQVVFDSSGARTSLTVDHRIYVTGLYDHSIIGGLTIAESAGATSRTITGSISVYHNLLKIIGTSTFSQVVHKDGCCLPVEGSITTQFRAGTSTPGKVGEAYVGQSEILTFTGCGTATFQAFDGTVSSVTLSRCF